MLSFLNSFFCLGCIVVCACRLGSKMSAVTTKPIIRIQYVMWLGLSMFLWIDRPLDLAHIIMSATLFANLLITYPAWKHGPPPHAMKQ